MEVNEKQKELIERIGVFYERKGMQPLVGKIIGLLLVHEQAEAAFDEIIETLGVSKSAVSNALTFLQAKNYVIYTSKLGERKRYFTLKSTDWKADFEQELEHIADIQRFLEEVLAIRPGETQEFNDRLRDFCDFLEFFRNEIPSLFERFKNQRG
ncbi:hypothetical protein [Algoriphagus sp. CAU 1675]|uniref:GbsR/MarR family transcriptional regulator n=1 Tax=Algoriphagus sp. CAU 1675 TaxID=3032597 RepID=UPI0023DB6E86|nr:hypothetical protein [Algoriphagus sp. CAU 1675]MDF2157035.1 hypothetical protein [Algoriphagus sp. CAU 1675]